MHTRTTLILLVLVGGLSLYLFGPFKPQPAPTEFGRRAAFEGLVAGRIERIEVDQVYADSQIVLERDAMAEWFMVEPVAWRGEPGVVSYLLDSFESLVAEPAPDLTDESFGELQVRFEFTERLGSGPDNSARSVDHVLELGALDLDRTRIAARVDGRLARVSRTLLDAAKRPVKDYRSKRLLRLDPGSIQELERRGTLRTAEAPIGPLPGGVPAEGADELELGFKALSDGGLWFATEPERVRLSPTFMFTAVVNPLANFGIEAFVHDAPMTLVPYGLDDPAFEVELTVGGGDGIVLQFGTSPEEASVPFFDRAWFAKLRSEPQVFAVAPGAVSLLAKDVRTMADELAFLVRREDIAGFELERAAGGGLRFARGQGERRPGWEVLALGDGPEAAVPADRNRAEDSLSELLDLEFVAWLEPEELERAGPARGRVTIVSTVGDRWVLEVGGELDLGAVRGFAARREGEGLWGLIADDVLAAAALAPTEFYQLQPFLLTDTAVSTLRVRRGAEDFGWVRNRSSGAWQPLDVEAEDRGFSDLADGLLGPRVSRWLLEGERVEPADVLEIELESFDSRSDRTYRLGLAEVDGEPRELLWIDDRLGLLEGGLLGALELLLER